MVVVLSSFWIYLGRIAGEETWLTSLNERADVKGDKRIIAEKEQSDIMIAACYWVITTLTTVGYGDIYGKTHYEQLYMMILEFLGIFMFSIFMGTISDLLGHEPQLSDIIDERMEELDVWLRKLDKSRTGLLPRTTYEAIKDFVLKSFFHDFNLIRGEEFFDQLKPRIRHKMVKELFS